MPESHPRFSITGQSIRFGFSPTEILVLIGIVMILVCIAAGPLTRHFEQSKINTAVENARGLDLLLSQYATDNNDTYPVGLGTSAPGTSEGIARNLLVDKYASDPAVFALGSALKYRGAAPDFSDFAASNIDWDFTGGATRTTGITASASEFLPTVYSTGQTVTYMSNAGTGLDLTLSGYGPFANSGIIVAYKNNTATFIRGTPSTTTTTCQGFISHEYKDTAAYTQIKP